MTDLNDTPANDTTLASKPAKAVKKMSVADLARELGINPKIARARLRRANIHANSHRHEQFARNDAIFKRYKAIMTNADAKGK